MHRDDRNSILLLGPAHFAVDLSCTAALTLLAGGLPVWQVTACAILYNGLAFAFQLPVGAIGDLRRLHRGLAALGCALVAVGMWIGNPLPAAAVMGLGNACFHVGGGRESLKRGGAKAAPVGRFVAPGAVGIFLGPRIAGLTVLVKWILPLCLLALALLFIRTRAAGEAAEQESIAACAAARGRLTLIAGCMFLTVLLRSYMGTVLRYPFLSDSGWALLYTVCIFGGKYLGGILADRFGAVKFSVTAQTLATVLFALSPAVPLLAFPAIFLFNSTMAVTAWKLYTCLPRYPGTMFGLTTFALYLGVLPKLLGLEIGGFSWWGLGLLSLVSGVLLVVGLLLGKEAGEDDTGDCQIADSVPGADAGV